MVPDSLPYSDIKREAEHQASEETVDEALNANDWTFTAQGKRFG